MSLMGVDVGTTGVKAVVFDELGACNTIRLPANVFQIKRRLK